MHSLSLSTLSLCAWYINFSFYFLFQTISLSSTRFYLSLFLSDISRYVFGDLLVLPLNICSLKNFGDYYYCFTSCFSSFFTAFWDYDRDFYLGIWCILGLNVHSLSSSFCFILCFYCYCICSLSFFFCNHSIYLYKNYSFLSTFPVSPPNDEFATGYSVILSVISNYPLTEPVPTMICV